MLISLVGLHRTLRLNVPQSEIDIGVPAYSNPDDNKLWNVLLMPFQKQRDYWCRLDGTIVERNPAVVGEDPTYFMDCETLQSEGTDCEERQYLVAQKLDGG
ncbi:MAG: hypothetical protein KME06_04450 [Kastovskya adunca ATA6-11-RM4]|nr:hypothetical protein [Kastovskya adunca ATA6-11-RM4]